jgi:lipoprotein Spr
MKLLLKLFTVILIISTTATSCVSNYVVSNNNHKYPTTNELLANQPKSLKGPNAALTNEKKLIADKTLLTEDKASLVENSNIYAEKEFSNEAFNLIVEAKTYLGTPYRYGGTTQNGIDCSSFVQHVFAAFDIPLPRTSVLQSQEGVRISKSELKKGDLIFFAHSPKSRISHVGIVESVSLTGEIFFIHASSSQGVTISSLDTAYWKTRFRTGKRILNSEEEYQKIPEYPNENINLVKVSF